MMGAGLSAAAQHSQAPYNVFTAVAGLKVVVPSNPYDAKGLLITAIRDDDPVVFCEHKLLYGLSGEVPDGAYTIPFGEANYTREGEDVTVIAFSAMVPRANAVADRLKAEGILESVAHTGRVVIVDESAARVGIAHDIAALVADQGFRHLRAPVKIVTPPHTPVPFSPPLEKAWLPSEARIEAAIRAVLKDA
jgi:pyruvate dehydrogenase E1 component beta subunit